MGLGLPFTSPITESDTETGIRRRAELQCASRLAQKNIQDAGKLEGAAPTKDVSICVQIRLNFEADSPRSPIRLVLALNAIRLFQSVQEMNETLQLARFGNTRVQMRAQAPYDMAIWNE